MPCFLVVLSVALCCFLSQSPSFTFHLPQISRIPLHKAPVSTVILPFSGVLDNLLPLLVSRHPSLPCDLPVSSGLSSVSLLICATFHPLSSVILSSSVHLLCFCDSPNSTVIAKLQLLWLFLSWPLNVDGE